MHCQITARHHKQQDTPPPPTPASDRCLDILLLASQPRQPQEWTRASSRQGCGSRNRSCILWTSNAISCSLCCSVHHASLQTQDTCTYLLHMLFFCPRGLSALCPKHLTGNDLRLLTNCEQRFENAPGVLSPPKLLRRRADVQPPAHEARACTELKYPRE